MRLDRGGERDVYSTLQRQNNFLKLLIQFWATHKKKLGLQKHCEQIMYGDATIVRFRLFHFFCKHFLEANFESVIRIKIIIIQKKHTVVPRKI